MVQCSKPKSHVATGRGKLAIIGYVHPMTNLPPQTVRAAPATGIAALGILFASITFGIVPVFSRGMTEAGLAPHAVAFYRYLLGAVLLIPFLWRERTQMPALIWGLGSGVVMGLGWIGYVIALETIPVSTVGVIYMTYPAFTLVIAWLLFGERPSNRAMIASGLILTAAVIASAPAAVDTGQLPVLLMAFSAPFGFGFAICVLVHRLQPLTPLSRIGTASVGSMFGLLPLVALSAPETIIPADTSTWMMVAGIGLVTALIPQLIYVVCSPVIGTARTAVIGSIELPTMFAVGILVFGEVLTFSQATACLLVLAAILLTRSRTTRNVTTTIARR